MRTIKYKSDILKKPEKYDDYDGPKGPLRSSLKKQLDAMVAARAK